eukprot:TRINITY_DN64141_c0_g1_i1.p1 TRINITY_DN64141_c0_g1~~TRINITY_DN64141_c0_g1_i1.p1  ORF type:complete len:626 (-),score=82.85 TRINITY_DN64141_c0_g1_i1:6-1883(-)
MLPPPGVEGSKAMAVDNDVAKLRGLNGACFSFEELVKAGLIDSHQASLYAAERAKTLADAKRDDEPGAEYLSVWEMCELVARSDFRACPDKSIGTSSPGATEPRPPSQGICGSWVTPTSISCSTDDQTQTAPSTSRTPWNSVFGEWVLDRCGGIGSHRNPQVQVQASRRTALWAELRATGLPRDACVEISAMRRGRWGLPTPILVGVADCGRSNSSSGRQSLLKVDCQCEMQRGEVWTLVLACGEQRSDATNSSGVANGATAVSTAVARDVIRPGNLFADCEEESSDALPPTPTFELRVQTSSPLARGPELLLPRPALPQEASELVGEKVDEEDSVGRHRFPTHERHSTTPRMVVAGGNVYTAGIDRKATDDFENLLCEQEKMSHTFRNHGGGASRTCTPEMLASSPRARRARPTMELTPSEKYAIDLLDARTKTVMQQASFLITMESRRCRHALKERVLHQMRTLSAEQREARTRRLRGAPRRRVPNPMFANATAKVDTGLHPPGSVEVSPVASSVAKSHASNTDAEEGLRAQAELVEQEATSDSRSATCAATRQRPVRPVSASKLAFTTPKPPVTCVVPLRPSSSARVRSSRRPCSALHPCTQRVISIVARRTDSGENDDRRV